MRKNKIPNIFIFFFLSLAVFASVYLVGKNQLLQKFAEEKYALVSFSILPQGKLNRIWQNFAQGGEEHKPMLSPAFTLIRSLQPRYIRIDHLFDFPDLDKRVAEIIQTGARPFLSLSYFPPSVSTDLTVFPADLSAWQTLVQKTIQEYSGKSQKNLLDIYYEVWNEPDLFGKMSPEQYYNLYRVSVLAAEKCQNCNIFKIGGPAITTLKKDWLEKFLRLAGENKTRLDFISWHSYQINPEKTAVEAGALKNLDGYKRYFAGKEVIISEWGPVPEISSIYDSYASAGHVLAGVEKLKTLTDKIFAFELIDGLNPEGKKYWGRWGLMTNPVYGLTPKPRFYAFLYLNKLLEYEIKPQISPREIAVIGSTDAKENYAFVVSLRERKNASYNINFNFTDSMPGTYKLNSYFLDSSHQPLIAESQTVSVNKDLNANVVLAADTVVLLEINRISPALITAGGKTDLPQDLSAKLTVDLPPLTFPVNLTAINQAEFSFWFKANWNDRENQKHVFLESKNPVGDGISAWYENQDSPKIIFSFTGYGETVERVSVPIELLDRNTWHSLSFSFDNTVKIMRAVFDGKESITQTNSNIKFGEVVLVGGSSRENNSAEGFIDDLAITVNQAVLYQKSFD